MVAKQSTKLLNRYIQRKYIRACVRENSLEKKEIENATGKKAREVWKSSSDNTHFLTFSLSANNEPLFSLLSYIVFVYFTNKIACTSSMFVIYTRFSRLFASIFDNSRRGSRNHPTGANNELSTSSNSLFSSLRNTRWCYVSHRKYYLGNRDDPKDGYYAETWNWKKKQ